MDIGKKFLSTDLAIIIPTKDRPQSISNLLSSLVRQSQPCGRIVIVASGVSIQNVIDHFAEDLFIDYIHSNIAGQIRQRNLGIQRLDERTTLAATLDDDIVLEDRAIEEMINFWNGGDHKMAGVGFNIVNEPKHQFSRLKKLIGLSWHQPGKVLASGWPTSICQVDRTIQTEWLNGGATVWRQDILTSRMHKEIKSKWSVFEDLIFSYPISKSNSLFICAEAKVEHKHIVDQKVSENLSRYRGRCMMLWALYFVHLNSDLSKRAFFLSWFIISFGNLGRVPFSKQSWNQLCLSWGQIEGGIIGVRALINGKPFQSILEKYS